MDGSLSEVLRQTTRRRLERLSREKLRRAPYVVNCTKYCRETRVRMSLERRAGNTQRRLKLGVLLASTEVQRTAGRDGFMFAAGDREAQSLEQSQENCFGRNYQLEILRRQNGRETAGMQGSIQLFSLHILGQSRRFLIALGRST